MSKRRDRGKQNMASAKKEMNMTEGPFFKKIVIFILPLVLTGLLQTLYNAADLVVIGHFRGELALAAVGSTGSLTNLIVGLFMGLSAGVGVVVAYYMGAMQPKIVSKVVHTSILIALIAGVFVGILGFVLAPEMLRWMDTPETVLDGAVLYIRIIFVGVPASILYNYCAAMLRSTGDTKRPLIFLSIAGLTNVVLNVALVAGCGFGVEGVAIATIVSQYLSAVMILIYMARTDGVLKFSFRRLRLEKNLAKKILTIGIPSGIQSSLFSLANVLIQSSINVFGDVTVAGNSAGSNLEGFVYIAMNAVYHASLTFVGQNLGAGTLHNVKKIVWQCILCVTVIGLTLGGVILAFGDFFVGLYASEPETIAAGLDRIRSILPVYFLCGIMEVLSGAIRGLGKSMTSMVISLLGACVFRIVWIQTMCRLFPQIQTVYLSWPISWVLVIAANTVALVMIYKKMVRKKSTDALAATL